MSYNNKIEQKSKEWWDLKVGKISGTRFGQLISTRENSLIEELADEELNGYCEISDFEDEDMLFGTENEELAIDLYEKHSGIKFKRGGVLFNDTCDVHIASPDGLNDDDLDYLVVAEVKCTRHGKTQLKRFRKGIDSAHIPQVVNYFAVEPKVMEVHFVSYCPFRPERPLVIVKVKRDTILEAKETKKWGLEIITVQDKVNLALELLPKIKQEVTELKNSFKQLEF